MKSSNFVLASGTRPSGRLRSARATYQGCEKQQNQQIALTESRPGGYADSLRLYPRPARANRSPRRDFSSSQAPRFSLPGETTNTATLSSHQPRNRRGRRARRARCAAPSRKCFRPGTANPVVYHRECDSQQLGQRNESERCAEYCGQSVRYFHHDLGRPDNQRTNHRHSPEPGRGRALRPPPECACPAAPIIPDSRQAVNPSSVTPGGICHVFEIRLFPP